MIKQEITFDEFVEQHNKLAYSILAKYGLSNNKDLYYGCLRAAWRGYASYDPEAGAKLTTYCYTCMHNEVKGALKKEQRRRKYEMSIYRQSAFDEEEMNMLDIMPDQYAEKALYKMEEDEDNTQKLNIILSTVDKLIDKAKGARLKVLLAWRDTFNYDANKMQLEEETGVTYAYCYQVLQETRYQIRIALKREGYI